MKYFYVSEPASQASQTLRRTGIRRIKKKHYYTVYAHKVTIFFCERSVGRGLFGRRAPCSPFGGVSVANVGTLGTSNNKSSVSGSPSKSSGVRGFDGRRIPLR